MEMEIENHNLKEATEEEADLPRRGKRRSNDDDVMIQGDPGNGKKFSSYKELVIRDKGSGERGKKDLMTEGEVSDDDTIEEGDDEAWFGIGMTREEKIEARRPWRSSLIIKLIGRSIGYHYLWRRIQAM